MNVNARYALKVDSARQSDVLDAMSKVGWAAEVIGRVGNGDGEGQLVVMVSVPAPEESVAKIKFGVLQRDDVINSFERMSQYKFT